MGLCDYSQRCHMPRKPSRMFLIPCSLTSAVQWRACRPQPNRCSRCSGKQCKQYASKCAALEELVNPMRSLWSTPQSPAGHHCHHLSMARSTEASMMLMWTALSDSRRRHVLTEQSRMTVCLRHLGPSVSSSRVLAANHHVLLGPRSRLTPVCSTGGHRPVNLT